VNSDPPSDYEALRRLAEDLHKSRLFRTASVEQALAVVLMGRELGIGPTVALSNIIISAGKPTLGAALVGALIQKSGKYAYTVMEMNDQSVKVEFHENLGSHNGLGVRQLGISTFTLQDAQRAGLANSPTWKSYPRNLLLARAITNGARWFCPEVFGGAIYDPEELGIAGVLPGPATGAPPEGGDATGSGPGVSPSGGAVDAADAEFVPNGDPPLGPHPVTLEALLEDFTAEEILAANDGQLPGTDAEVTAAYARLTSGR